MIFPVSSAARRPVSPPANDNILTDLQNGVVYFEAVGHWILLLERENSIENLLTLHWRSRRSQGTGAC